MPSEKKTKEASLLQRMDTHKVFQHVHAKGRHVCSRRGLPLPSLEPMSHRAPCLSSQDVRQHEALLGCLGLFPGQATIFPHWLLDPILAAASKLCLAPRG